MLKLCSRQHSPQPRFPFKANPNLNSNPVLNPTQPHSSSSSNLSLVFSSEVELSVGPRVCGPSLDSASNAIGGQRPISPDPGGDSG